MIHQEIALAAPVATIYQILTNSQRFSDMTGGASADLSAEQASYTNTTSLSSIG